MTRARLATGAVRPVLSAIKFFGRHRNGMIRDGVIRSVAALTLLSIVTAVPLSFGGSPAKSRPAAPPDALWPSPGENPRARHQGPPVATAGDFHATRLAVAAPLMRSRRRPPAVAERLWAQPAFGELARLGRQIVLDGEMAPPDDRGVTHLDDLATAMQRPKWTQCRNLLT